MVSLEKIKDSIQSCNVNFLIGSGMSLPYLTTLGNVESLLTELENVAESHNTAWKITQASLYKKYFDEVIFKNLFKICEGDDDYKNVLENYTSFLHILNELILRRKGTLLNKQINLFTTNIDIFLERALELLNLEFNDGFKGRLSPTFNLSNYHLSYFKTSLHYENVSEVPVFNLFKLHGSINWVRNIEKAISLDTELRIISGISEKLNAGRLNALFLPISDSSKIAQLLSDSQKSLKTQNEEISELSEFVKMYEELQIINPTKEKFKSSILNVYYYEMLRMFANDLEKENSLLFVMGFSFRDEHLREIILRAANSNPTLQIYIFAYDSDAQNSIIQNLNLNTFGAKNNNILIFTLEDLMQKNQIADVMNSDMKKKFDFKTIIKSFFGPIRDQALSNIIGHEERF